VLNYLIYFTAISLFFNITLKLTETFLPPWQEHKNSMAAETAFLHLQPLMNSHFHFHFLVTVESVTSKILLQ
jgi:hypothetical protein